ncbi:MAG: ABC transporter permease [Deltaproteobacteria bacterium]|jgi:ABC-type dipeptide/oligopeptide/nickel transport system permease component|nr:ABC transporter permease [Deltaproteobacteria bacterium]MBT4525248.1 ABC transporter permease [Deltaproteobacteria bacterium]
MLSYIIKRLFIAIPTLLGVTLLVFSMIHMIPGDPVVAMLGERGAIPEEMDMLRTRLGLDKPLYVQYYIFLKQAVTLDFGISYWSNEEVIVEFMDRFPATLELAITALLFGSIVGVSAGIISSVKKYSIFDYSSMFIALAGVSMPIFWLGLLMIYLFSVTLGWLPVSGRLASEYFLEDYTGFLLIDSLLLDNYEFFECETFMCRLSAFRLPDDMGAFWSTIKHLVLPAIALSTIPMSVLARITRAAMLEVLAEDYVRTARAKGCSRFQVIFVHALRNAAIPIVTTIGVFMGLLLAGAVLTETTFSWPGIGKWVVHAVYTRDYPIVQATVLFIAVGLIFINLLVDLLYALINPKIRLQ